jgi:nicotinamidase-related amidase
LSTGKQPLFDDQPRTRAREPGRLTNQPARQNDDADNPFGLSTKTDSVMSQAQMKSLGTHQALRAAAGKAAHTHKKRRESCFAGLDGEALQEQLKSQGVRTVIIMGRYHDSCTRLTICDALDKGYRVLTASELVHGPIKGDEKWKEHAKLEWYQS